MASWSGSLGVDSQPTYGLCPRTTAAYRSVLSANAEPVSLAATRAAGFPATQTKTELVISPATFAVTLSGWGPADRLSNLRSGSSAQPAASAWDTLINHSSPTSTAQRRPSLHKDHYAHD